MLMTLLLTTLSQAAVPVAPATPVSVAVREKLVCRTIGVTGSRLGEKRVCHTKREWEEASTDARENLERARNGAISNGR